MKPFDIGIFVPAGQALLIGSFGYRLIRGLKDDEDLAGAFEALVVSMLALVFFRQGADLLSRISAEFLALLERAGGGASLFKQLGAALDATKNEKFMTPEAAASTAILRYGIWGALISISQFIFLCAEGVFGLAQKVFWNLVIVLLPIAAGLFPAFPSMLKSLALYAVELSLWLPILYLINYSAGVAASSPEVAQAALGLGVVITQVLAVFLIFNVPPVTHRFMSGAFNHLLGAEGPAYQKVKSLGALAGQTIHQQTTKKRFPVSKEGA